MSTSNTALRKAGLKVTLPRIKILELLESAQQHHMSAEDVYKTLLEQGEDVGLATVYRVLTQFESAGIVQRHHFESGSSVFELCDGDHHDHIVCRQCGRVFEFTDRVIEERQEVVATELGFILQGHALHLYGDCRRESCDRSGKGSGQALPD